MYGRSGTHRHFAIYFFNPCFRVLHEGDEYVVGLSSLGKVRNFLFFSVSEGGMGLCFCYVFTPFLEKGILDYIAHRPIIQVFSVSYLFFFFTDNRS